MVAALSVQHLSVGLPGERPLLDKLSFELAPGERVGLVGASGCGKSLTASTLCGLLRAPLCATQGSVRIDGTEILGASAATLRGLRGRAVFQIFQSPSTALTPVRRIGVQLDEAAHVAGVDARTATRAALETVDLAPHVSTLFSYQLSGGMKQRVLIAMALILRPRILIADEPTTGLDILTERGILAALNAMVDETGAALVFISHDLRAVRDVAARTLVLHHGRLVEDDHIDHLAHSQASAARKLAEAAVALQDPC